MHFPGSVTGCSTTWRHGPAPLSSKFTASQINNFTGTSNAWWLNQNFQNHQRLCELFRKNTAYQTHNLKVTSHHPLRSARDFFNNKVIKYWNQLPLRVRYSTSINAFKAGLDHFKLSKPDSPIRFWELSEPIFNRISDKSEHVNYLLANRDVAMRKYLVLILSFSCFYGLLDLLSFLR